jgi:hypothetical protein
MYRLFVVLSAVAAHQEPSCGNANERGNAILAVRDREAILQPGSMVSQRPQCADDVFDSILLKQADPGDAGRSRVQARCGVLHRDAAESEDGNFRPAGFPQGAMPAGCVPTASFSEHRSENGEVGSPQPRRESPRRQCGRKRPPESGQWSLAGGRSSPRAHLHEAHVVGAQMDAVGSAASAMSVRELIRRRVASRFEFSRSAADRFSCQPFQFPRAQIFFAKLDVVDAGTGRLRRLWRAAPGGGRVRRRETGFGR